MTKGDKLWRSFSPDEEIIRRGQRIDPTRDRLSGFCVAVRPRIPLTRGQGLDGTGRQNDQKTHPEGVADRHRILPPQTSALTPAMGLPESPSRFSSEFMPYSDTLRLFFGKGKRKV
ncbi:MAG: hypothetical protein Kow001_02790 [Acidobacteriota bacterium]